MALENYTRGQKIFMVTLVVALAALFTVTGAMLAVVDQTGQTVPADRGTFDGSAVRLVEFQRKSRALGIIQGLDRASTPTSPDAPQFIYARVPTMAVSAHYGHDWPYNAQRPVDTSLLEIWPQYQDQHVWCHIAMAKRARDAGIQEPGAPYIGRVITALMNQYRQDLEKFSGENFTKEFEKTYGSKIDELLPTFIEAIMIREYVESLIADERARLDRIAHISTGNHEEIRAEYARLKVGYFLAEAREDVRRESFAFQAASAAAGFGPAGTGLGYDRFEEAYDKNRARSLFSDATFGFEIIRAYPQELVDSGKVAFDRDFLELTYDAVREEMFKATDAQKTDIEARLEAEYTRYNRDNPDETREWTAEQVQTWKDERKPDMLNFRSFYESEAELRQALQRKESLRAAQAAISGFVREIEEERNRRQRSLNAAIEVIRKEEQVYEGQRSYLEQVRVRYDSLQTQLAAKLRGINSQIDGQGEGFDDAASQALNRIVDELVRELFNFDREQIESLLTTARVARSLERELNEKKSAAEEFDLEEDKRNPDGRLMTAEEIAAKVSQFKLEIQAIEARIALRDVKVPLAEAFAEELREALANYELQIRNVRDGDPAARRYVLRELMAEMQVDLGAAIVKRRDADIPQDEIDALRDRAELIRADHTARSKKVSEDAADTRDWNITDIITRHGLRVVPGGSSMTWEQVVNSGTLGFLENVDGARSFLEDPGNASGATSGIMVVPGQGYLVLRLAEKRPKYNLGRVEAHDKVVTLAAMKRARELAVDALNQLRRDILKDGWDKTIAAAKAKYGEFFEVAETPFFTDRMDIPGVYSDSDSEVLNYSSSPSVAAPDQPFVSRIREIDPSEGISKLIPEKRNEDTLRRPENEQWSYLIARVIERRLVDRRMGADDMKDRQWGSTPAEVWRSRHLSASKVVFDLVNPAEVLKPHTIVLFKADEDEDEKDNKAGTTEE